MYKIIPTKENVKTITDLRQKPIELLRQIAKTGGPLYIFYRSKPVAAIVDFETLSAALEIQQATEDLNRAIDTSGGEFIDFEKLDRSLRKKDGLPAAR